MIFATHRTLKRALQLFLVLSLAACSEPKTISGFDSDAWKNDTNGCKGERARIWKDFASRKNELMGYKENDLKSLLGKEEKSQLMERGQKLYFFDISGSANCQNAGSQPALQLQIRVNSLGIVSEVQQINPNR